MKHVLLLFLILVSSQSYAIEFTSPDPTLPAIDKIVTSATKFVAQQQRQKDDEIFLRGEWPAVMHAYFLPALLGVGKIFGGATSESTAFESSSVMNLLAETYSLRPTLTEIPNLIHNAKSSLTRYQDGNVYAYYRSQNYRGVTVRGPRAKGYVPNYIRGLTNIPPDADTTSATYLALAYAKQIDEKTKLRQFEIPQATLDVFATYRDVHRRSHYFDWIQGIRSSGGFLTWLEDDRDPKMPKGIFAPPDKGVRIPFGVNDVDCVVNANVMRLLTETGHTDIPGYADSCQLLNFVINKDKQKLCGIYYPNSYAVFSSISNVYKAGASCLEDSRTKALQYLITTQTDDGGWLNEPGIGHNDPVQSTALALNALVNYAPKGDRYYKQSIESGITYLLRHAVVDGDQQTAHWKGEVFFSAVAQARNTVLWMSDSYTTALASLALVKAQDYLRTIQ